MRRSSLASSDPYQGVKDVSAFLACKPPVAPAQAPEAPASRRSSITGAPQGRRGSVTVTPAFQNFRLGPTEVGLLPSDSSTDSEKGYKRNIPRGPAERRASLVDRRGSVGGRRGSAGYTGTYLDAGVAVRANIAPRAGADSPSRRPPMPAGRRVSLTLHSVPDAARFPGRAVESDDERMEAGRNSITEIMTRVAGSFRRKPSDQSVHMTDGTPQGRANLYSNKGVRDRDSLYQYSSGSESDEADIERRFHRSQNGAERRNSAGVAGGRRDSYGGGRRDSYGGARRDSYAGGRRDSYGGRGRGSSAGARSVRTPAGGRRSSYVSAVTADPAGTRRRESSSYSDNTSDESSHVRRRRRQSKPAEGRDRGERMSRRSTKETDDTRPPTERKPPKLPKEIPADEPWEIDDDDLTARSHQLPTAPQQPATSTSAGTTGANATGNAEKKGNDGEEAGSTSDDDDTSQSQPGNEEEFAEDFKFVRKTLPRSAISHEEERMEFRCLDYSPLVNVRPVDMKEELRPIKASRKIRLYVCITCYNEDGKCSLLS
jgi:hypothetical protein